MRAGAQWPVPDEGLHQTFARTARAHPDATALTGAGGPVTYRALDRAADAWAARLSAAGAGPGRVVPVLLPRGTALVTALLAVLKTGAAYALLDPAWPERRLRDVLDLLDAPVLAGPHGDGGRAPGGPPVCPPPADGSTAPEDFRPASVRSGDPCCVFFTSGTTGRPKGVLSPHRATARLFPPPGAGGFADIRPGAVVPVAAPMPWDAFSLELWGALLNGGTALLVDEPYLSPQALRRAVAEHGADTVWLTAGLFNMVVDEDPDAFAGLRRLITGGERLSPGHVARFLRRHPGTVLLNGYGPVESTVFATTHRVTEDDCDAADGIPLGVPVPGTQVYVLDGTRPCGPGETGEICLAGQGLALRYLGDPALTDAAFTTLVLDGRPTRVYRTGDLGSFGADGLLRYGGRADRQIKIRGHRVEPAEVERQIEELLPGVRGCRVLPRRDAHGAVRDLIAFCVPRTAGDPLTGARRVLDGALVAYQRPSTVVGVPAFPLTAAGKLDERALLALLDDAPPATGADTAAPAPAAPDATEQAVAETFAAVLRRPAVPSDASFFELGGTSLDAGRVCARLSARLDRPVPVSALYRDPTPAGLAALLRARSPRDPGPAAGPDGVPLTPLQLVYLTRHLTDPGDRTGECRLSWVIEGEPDRTALAAAIARTHERHEPLRARYVADPAPAAVLPGLPAPELEEVPPQPTLDAAFKALDDRFADGLEPTEGEVWRTALVPVDDGGAPRAVLGCVVHHLAFDGWSESVLARELAAGYRRALGLPAAADPAVPTLAQAHAERVRRAAHTDLEAQRARLLRELSGAPDLVWPAGPRTPLPVRHRALRLPPASVAALDAEAAAAGATRFTALLRRFARALAGATGQHDLTVGVPVAQRDTPLTQHAVGCHLTMVPLRLRGPVLADGPAAVRATARLVADALAAQDVPFHDLLQAAGRRPDGGRPPLYQVLFALQDNAPAALDLPGATTRFVRLPYADLPLEFHAELWPEPDGGLRLAVSYRPAAVPETAVDTFLDHFRTDAAGRPAPAAPPAGRTGGPS
ncbi:amino acid adenylation domain-containing protein [Streptomyces chilikensis]|uniref:Amino acid adenylation domain-containing protein n=1 Tax=Streptomyces chilikensis TaxID=1194079 RepID=A0ABV3EZG6_9ACTN